MANKKLQDLQPATNVQISDLLYGTQNNKSRKFTVGQVGATSHGGNQVYLPLPAMADVNNPPVYKYVNSIPYQFFSEGNIAKWVFRMPDIYNSDAVLKVLFIMESATSGSVNLAVRVDAVPVGQAAVSETYAAANTVSAAVPATAGELGEASIALTNDDGLTAGNLVSIKLERQPGGGASGAMQLVAAVLAYS